MKSYLTMAAAAAALLLAACGQKDTAEPWRQLPRARLVKPPYGDYVEPLPGTNRYRFCERLIGLPKYAAIYTRPGQDPDSIMPLVFGVDERHLFSNLLFADTQNLPKPRHMSAYTGDQVTKHSLESRCPFPELKLKDSSRAVITMWHNQSAIREANIRRWNDILEGKDEAYLQRMAKAFRTTNTQTDEVWDDSVDLTLKLDYVTNGYRYVFYQSGNSAHDIAEAVPLDPFRPLTAEIAARPRPGDPGRTELQLYFSYDGGPRYYMYKRSYDELDVYWRQAEHVTLQNDPAKVPVTLAVNGQECQPGLTLQDFVTGYFQYCTFTNFVTGVSVETPSEPAKVVITVDGGPLYGPVRAEATIGGDAKE